MRIVVVAVAVSIRILQDSSAINQRLVGVGDKVGIRRRLDVGCLLRKEVGKEERQ